MHGVKVAAGIFGFTFGLFGLLCLAMWLGWLAGGVPGQLIGAGVWSLLFFGGMFAFIAVTENSR